MLKNLLIATIAALFASTASANATTIDFGDYNDTNFGNGDTYSEDGYTFTHDSGDEFAITAWPGDVYGSSLFVGYSAQAEPGDTISIKRSNGELFTFDSVQYRSGLNGSISEGMKLVGLVEGVAVFTISNLQSSSNVWDTLDSELRNFIDELQIVSVSQGVGELLLDNFEFSEVPLPAAVWMFLAGLGGLGFARKKRAA